MARTWLFAFVWLVVWVLLPALLLGWQPVLVSSGSMEPVVHAGDVLLLDPASRSPTASSIVTFDTDRGLVTHRVVATSTDGTYRTKGDANRSPDSSPVQPAQIQGTARLVVPAIGLPRVWITQRQWGALSAATAMTLLALATARLPATCRPRHTRRRRVGQHHRHGARAAVVVTFVVTGLLAPSWSTASWLHTSSTGTSWAADVLAAPTDVTTSYSCGILGLLNDISVSWTAPPVAVDGYQVWRSTNDGQLTLMNNGNLITQTSWTDTDVDTGTSYRYVIRSVSGSWISPDTGANDATITTQSLCLL